MGFPLHISSLASQASHQIVATTWIQYAHEVVATQSSSAMIDAITQSIGLRLNEGFQYRHDVSNRHGHLGKLLLSQRPDHILFGYCGLSLALSKAYDQQLLEGVANVVRAGVSRSGTQEALLRSAAIASSSSTKSVDRMEAIMWKFVRSKGRAWGWYETYNITGDDMAIIGEVIERHLDEITLDELDRMIDFLFDLDQTCLHYSSGRVDDRSPLRLRLVRRLLREKDRVQARYDYPDRNTGFPGLYSVLAGYRDNSKLRGSKMIRNLEKMERELDPTRLPAPKSWTQFLPKWLRDLMGAP